jgi:hypothetical protein
MLIPDLTTPRARARGLLIGDAGYSETRVVPIAAHPGRANNAG